MPLSKERFLKGLLYLNDYYDNFKFDIKNVNKVEIWYDAFSNFDEEIYTNTIKTYCKENIYPPNSPTALTEFLKVKTIENRRQGLSSEEAFELALKSLRQNRYHIQSVIDEFERSNGVISKTVKELSSSFKAIQDDSDQIPFVKGQFVKAYERNLEIEVKQLILGSNVKLLE